MEEYLKSLLNNKPLLKSNFQAYWLSYPNKEKFYARKSKEFKNNFLDNIQVKLHQEFDSSLVKKLQTKCTDGKRIHKSTIEHQKVINYELNANKENPTDSGKYQDNGLKFNDEDIPIGSLDIQKDTPKNSHNSNIAQETTNTDDQETDYHLFLQDLKDCTTQNSSILKKAHEYTKDACFLVEQLKSKLSNLAGLYSDLTRNFTNLGTARIQAFEEISPPISRICSNMKLSIFIMEIRLMGLKIGLLRF